MMETRINRCLERCRAEKRGALVVYVTVGCPSPAESEALIGRLIEAGADMIELGVPFSDPMADGPDSLRCRPARRCRRFSRLPDASGNAFPKRRLCCSLITMSC